MSRRHADIALPVTAFVSIFNKEAVYAADRASSGALPVSGTCTADKAWYFPIVTRKATTIRRFWWLNGATVGTDNIQIGIYNPDFTSFLLGTSTLSAGANVCQFDDVTDTALPAGPYYLAFWCSGSVATVFRGTSTHSRFGALAETGLTGGLPATATPVSPGSSGFEPVFGFTSVASP